MENDFLKQFDKKNIYRVPEGFFDDMAYAIHENVAEASRSSLPGRLSRGLSYGIALVAIAFAGFIGYSSFFRKPPLTAEAKEYVSPVPRSIYNMNDSD